VTVKVQFRATYSYTSRPGSKEAAEVLLREAIPKHAEDVSYDLNLPPGPHGDHGYVGAKWCQEERV
jgi:hypothetical protein